MRKVIDTMVGSYRPDGTPIETRVEEISVVVYDNGFKRIERMYDCMLKEIAEQLIGGYTADNEKEEYEVIPLDDGVSYAYIEKGENGSNAVEVLKALQQIAPVNFDWVIYHGEGSEISNNRTWNVYERYADYIGGKYEYNELKQDITWEICKAIYEESCDEIYAIYDQKHIMDNVVVKRLNPYKAEDGTIVIEQLKIHYLESM